MTITGGCTTADGETHWLGSATVERIGDDQGIVTGVSCTISRPGNRHQGRDVKVLGLAVATMLLVSRRRRPLAEPRPG